MSSKIAVENLNKDLRVAHASLRNSWTKPRRCLRFDRHAKTELDCSLRLSWKQCLSLSLENKWMISRLAIPSWAAVSICSRHWSSGSNRALTSVFNPDVSWVAAIDVAIQTVKSPLLSHHCSKGSCFLMLCIKVIPSQAHKFSALTHLPSCDETSWRRRQFLDNVSSNICFMNISANGFLQWNSPAMKRCG